MKRLIGLLLCAAAAYAQGIVSPAIGAVFALDGSNNATTSTFVTTTGQSLFVWVNIPLGGGGCSGITATASLTSNSAAMALIGSVQQAPYVCGAGFRIDNVTGSATESVLFHTSIPSSSLYVSIHVLRLSSAAGGTDGTCTTSAAGTSSPVSCSSSVTPTANGIMVTGIANFYDSVTFGAQNGFAIPTGGTVTGNGSSSVAWQATTASTAYTPSFTVTGGSGPYAVMVGETFKVTGGGGGGGGTPVKRRRVIP